MRFRQDLEHGKTSVEFRPKLDELLSTLSNTNIATSIETFFSGFGHALQKLEIHIKKT